MTQTRYEWTFASISSRTCIFPPVFVTFIVNQVARGIVEKAVSNLVVNVRAVARRVGFLADAADANVPFELVLSGTLRFIFIECLVFALLSILFYYNSHFHMHDQEAFFKPTILWNCLPRLWPMWFHLHEWSNPKLVPRSALPCWLYRPIVLYK